MGGDGGALLLGDGRVVVGSVLSGVGGDGGALLLGDGRVVVGSVGGAGSGSFSGSGSTSSQPLQPLQ